MSAALVETSMSEADAQKLTERIRVTAHNYAEARDKLQALVAEAEAGNAHLALGYRGFAEYLGAVLGEEPLRLTREEGRPELVAELAGKGLSTRIIGSILGVGKSQVARDLASVPNGTDEPRTVHSKDGITRTFQPREPQVWIEPETEPAPKIKRRPITDQARDAGWELRKAVERIERLYQDAKFNADAASLLNPHIDYALTVLNTNEGN